MRKVLSAIKCFSWICFLALQSPLYGQWCCSDSTLLIQDKKTNTSKLQISGLLNNDLNDPMQGVCGVRIEFEHQFVGDVTMELISPSGQRVKLLGPAGNSGFTSFSRWYITLIPCGETAIPDPGFKPRWDNEQSWGLFGKFYNGTYYPFQGCLEDFNLGPVNGTWTLSVRDDENFYQGKVLSFCILFCDPRGITCQECSPNGGFFNVETKSYCEDDPGLFLNDRVIFPIFTPDPTSYGYQYFITQNDTIRAISELPDARNLQPGKYFICGISYLLADSAMLPKNGQVLSKYREDLLSNRLGICADLSKSCIGLEIHPVYKGLMEQITLCRGDSILRNGIWYKNEGQYQIPYQTKQGCDSTIFLDLKLVDFSISVPAIDTIDCNHSSIRIDISNSILSTHAHIRWTTINGSIIDSSNLLNIEVNDSGQYKVVIEDGSCMDSATFQVVKFGTVPDLLVEADTINCNHPIATLSARTSVPNPKFQWSDGMVLLGVDSILQVNSGGLYRVTLTDDRGCTNEKNIQVIVDTIPQTVLIFSDTITCRDTQVLLNFHSAIPQQVIGWFYQQGLIGTEDSILVSTGGRYWLEFVGRNGCLGRDSIDVVNNKHIPDYSLVLDTLNCLNQMQFVLRARSNSSIATIEYADPLNGKLMGLNPTIHIPGRYRLMLKDTFGCLLDTSFIVAIDTTTPTVKLQADTMNCSRDSVQLRLSVNGNDSLSLAFEWFDTQGSFSSFKEPYVNKPGTYRIAVTAPNGCMFHDSIRVLSDSTRPDIQIDSVGSLNCLDRSMLLIAKSMKADSFLWNGPGVVNDTNAQLNVSEPGRYMLTAISSNGCESEQTIQIVLDTFLSIGLLSSDTLSCNKDSAQISVQLNHPMDSLQWNGPGNFRSNQLKPKVLVGGRYVIQVWGTNHCLDTASLEVVYDTLVPQVELISDTIGCNKLNATIQVVKPLPGVTYHWKFPNGDSTQAASVVVSDTGWFHLITTYNNGCSRLDSTFVYSRLDPPMVFAVSDTLSCKKPQLLYGLKGNEANMQYVWRGPQNFNSTDSIIVIRLSGWYHFTVTNAFGCSSMDSVFIHEMNGPPNVIFNDPYFDCSTYQQGKLTARPLDSIVQFQWILPGGAAVNDTVVQVNGSGAYVFIASNPSGCQSVDTLMVIVDTLKPSILSLQVDTINCKNAMVFPKVSANQANVALLWIAPNGDTIRQSNPGFSIGGQYSVQVVGNNHCLTDSSFIIQVDTSIPSFTLLGDSLNCKRRSVRLVVMSSDSLANILWTTPSGQQIAQRHPTVADSGWYRLTVQGLNGCIKTDSIYVLDDQQLPMVRLENVFIPCNTDSVTLQLMTNDSSGTFSWSGPGMFHTSSLRPMVKDTGTYYLKLTAVNGCEIVDSCKVEYRRDPPQLTVVSPTLNCRQLTGSLKVVGDTIGVKPLWIGPGLQDSISWEPPVFIPGRYQFTAINQYGCRLDTALLVNLDTLHPQPQILALDSIICMKRNIQLTLVNRMPQLDYQWSTLNGSVVGPTNRDTLEISSPGDYGLLVTSQGNGCTGSANILVKEYNLEWDSVQILKKDPNCFGQANGYIQLVHLGSTFAPYEFSINAINVPGIGVFSDLAAGSYYIEIKGRYGCQLDTTIVLINPPPMILDVGRDTTIRYGQTYDIFPSTNANVNRLRSMQWITGDGLNCNLCFNTSARPLNTSIYTLELIDENGCMVEDALEIRVVIDPLIFMPNAFSPNGDQINDQLKLEVSPEIKWIQTLRIFDRWGNLVFEQSGFDPRLDKYSWDGTFKGQKMNPGVLVFAIEALTENGQIYRLAGDITILR